MKNESVSLSFFERLRLAWAGFSRSLGDSVFAGRVAGLLESKAESKPAALPPERVHASGLAVLATLQREGRLIDFLQEDMAAFSDEEIGAAARVVHAGCRKVLTQYLTLEPVLKEAEGATITVQFPTVSESLDPRIIAPAEVEL